MRIAAAVQTELGYKRTNNEDSYLKLDTFDFFAIADGMGGHNAGEHASRIAIAALNSYRQQADNGDIPVPEILSAAFSEAHESVMSSMSRHPERAGMGTTLSAVMFRFGKAYIAHVGDSRVYLSRNKETQQLTKDHGNMYGLSNVIGCRQDLYLGPQLIETDLKSGDIFTICSDGFSDYADAAKTNDLMLYGAGFASLTTEGRKKVLQERGDRGCFSNPEILANEFVQYALNQGGRDNVTVLVMIVKGD